MNQPEHFRLSEQELQSATWQRLMAHFAKRVEHLRSQLEGDKNDIDTAKLRGRLGEIRALIALDTPLTPPV